MSEGIDRLLAVMGSGSVRALSKPDISLLPSGSELSETKKELIESNTSIGKIVTVTLPNWDSVNTIITEDDTIVIFSKYKGGSVIVERKPVKK